MPVCLAILMPNYCTYTVHRIYVWFWPKLKATQCRSLTVVLANPKSDSLPVLRFAKVLSVGTTKHAQARDNSDTRKQIQARSWHAGPCPWHCSLGLEKNKHLVDVYRVPMVGYDVKEEALRARGDMSVRVKKYDI